MAAATDTLGTTAVLLGTVPAGTWAGAATLIVQNVGSTECFVDTVAGSGIAGIALAPASGSSPGGDITETKGGVSLYGWTASGSGTVTVDTI